MKLPKRLLALFAAAFAAAIFVGLMWRSDQYVEFRPVYLDGAEELVVADAASGPFLNELEIVLRCYQEPFRKTAEGRILVPRSLWSDRDLMWNYTTKANDPDTRSSGCPGAPPASALELPDK